MMDNIPGYQISVVFEGLLTRLFVGCADQAQEVACKLDTFEVPGAIVTYVENRPARLAGEDDRAQRLINLLFTH